MVDILDPLRRLQRGLFELPVGDHFIDDAVSQRLLRRYRIPEQEQFVGLARIRKKLIETSQLSQGHWRWASLAVLIIMGIFMAGMGLDMIGEMSVWIFLLALAFFRAFHYCRDWAPGWASGS